MTYTIKSAIDERLEKALEFANYRSTLNRQINNAKIKFQNSLNYSQNGGTFKVTPELISFVQTLISMEKQSGIFNDVHEKPVLIENLLPFRDTLVDLYYRAMNDYLLECNELRKCRSVKTLLEV